MSGEAFKPAVTFKPWIGAFRHLQRSQLAGCLSRAGLYRLVRKIVLSEFTAARWLDNVPLLNQSIGPCRLILFVNRETAELSIAEQESSDCVIEGKIAYY